MFFAEKEYPEIGIKVVAYKDKEMGKLFKSIELQRLNSNITMRIAEMIGKQYNKSLSKVYNNFNDFTETLTSTDTRVILVPDIQYGDKAVLNKFDAICSFIEKTFEDKLTKVS